MLIATFEDFILTAFVIIDELYFQYVPDAVSKRRNVLNAKLSDSEIITISICGELIGVDSENAWFSFVWFSFVKKNYHHLFPGIGSRSRFNRTRRSLLQVTELIRQKLFSAFAMPYSRYLVIDSFPLAVCKFGRARYCQSFRSDGADYGKCPSKQVWKSTLLSVFSQRWSRLRQVSFEKRNLFWLQSTCHDYSGRIYHFI